MLMMCLSVILHPVNAQYAHFIKSGKITFERNINMYAILGKNASPQDPLAQKFLEAYKAGQPQFNTSSFTLEFSESESLYAVENSKPPSMGFFGNIPWLSESTVYTNFKNDSLLALKEVYEKTYAVKDSMQSILWKMTDETREIAGYTCRRANGLILDSLYVVAFFTTEILPQGGPESFSGLPGMILGVALPHEHITWFATRVEEKNAVSVQAPVIKKGVKSYNRKALLAELHKLLGARSKRDDAIIKATLL